MANCYTLLLTLLLTSSGQEWLTFVTLLLTSSGQEWQFDIATHQWSTMAIYIATDIQWSRMQFHNTTDILVVKNGNFTLPLTSSGQEWQFHIATDI